MSSANNMNLVVMFFRLIFTILNGSMKLLVQGLMVIPKLLHQLLNVLVKLGFVFKLIFEPVLRMIGNLILETSRGLKGLGASSGKRRI
jgi:hypothetical protein